MRDIISLNSTNYIGNNLYRIRLPKATQFKKGDQISLYSFSMYNSFYNISIGLLFRWLLCNNYSHWVIY